VFVIRERLYVHPVDVHAVYKDMNVMTNNYCMIHMNTNGLFTQAVKFVGKGGIDIFVNCNCVDTRWQ